MLRTVTRLLLAFGIAVSVALAPIAVDACLLTCEASVNADASDSAHHACHHDAASHIASHAPACGHDHASVVDAVVRTDTSSPMPASWAFAVAALPNVAISGVVALTHAPSPPRLRSAVSAEISFVLPLRI